MQKFRTWINSKLPMTGSNADWKRTLWILWAANFAVMAGMSLIIPFLPYYIEFLGVHNLQDIERWAGWIISAQFVTSFLFQPLWGAAADRYGRKIMLLRSGFGMAGVIFLMGFVTAPWQLVALRFINGIFSGFISMAITLQASVTPNSDMGKALGTLQTGTIAGSLIGPLLGGLMAETIGYRAIFMVTGSFILSAGIIILLLVKEQKPAKIIRTDRDKADLHMFIPLLPIFFASFITQFGMMSIEPIVTVYAKTLYQGAHLEFIAGLVVAITGVANLFGAPTLGRLGDRIGQRKALMFALVMSAAAFVPQAFAGNISILLIGRFILGLFIGGMIPALNTLVKKLAPVTRQGTAYGFNTSALFLGNLIGPLVGSHIAASFGFRSVFYVTMSALLVNAAILFFNRKLELNIERQSQNHP